MFIFLVFLVYSMCFLCRALLQYTNLMSHYNFKASKAVTISQAVNQKPQKTFLRKGQGLARFKGKSTSNKTVGQRQESENRATRVLQIKENKAGNAVPNPTQGKNKSSVPSGVPVTQGRVSYWPCLFQS